MRKSVEIKKSIKELKNKIEAKNDAGDFDTAAALADDLEKMLKELKAAEAIEKSEEPENSADEDDEDEESDTTNSATFVPINRMSKAKAAVLRNRAFNKLVFGKKKFGKLTDEEHRAYFNDGTDTTITPSTTDTTKGQYETIDEKGGYLVPEENLKLFREYRKYRLALKDYCNVVQVNSKSGKFPTMNDEDGTLFDFDEMEKIPKDDLDFGQVKFDVHACGDIILVSNLLIQDADVNILDIVGKRFAIKALNSENAKILALMNTLTATPATGYKDFVSAINKKLDRAYFDSAKIFTNQDGFDFLDTLEDANKRPLLTVDVTEPSKYKFRGKEIVVLSNRQLKTTSKIPFWIGNLAEFCMFADRAGIEIAVSTEYAFDMYGTTLRCVERFGVVKDDSDALIKLEVSA